MLLVRCWNLLCCVRCRFIFVILCVSCWCVSLIFGLMCWRMIVCRLMNCCSWVLVCWIRWGDGCFLRCWVKVVLNC